MVEINPVFPIGAICPVARQIREGGQGRGGNDLGFFWRDPRKHSRNSSPCPKSRMGGRMGKTPLGALAERPQIGPGFFRFIAGTGLFFLLNTSTGLR